MKLTNPLNNFFKRLRLRELNNKGNLQLSRGNIFRDYHFREVGDDAIDFAELGIRSGWITHLVIAEDIICVIYCRTHLVPFKRNGEICKDDTGRLIVIPWDGDINFVCYNKFNYSLITVVSTLGGLERITSTQIASIKSGQITDPDESIVEPGQITDPDESIVEPGQITDPDESIESIADPGQITEPDESIKDSRKNRELFPDESIEESNFDVANCRGMICTGRKGVIKVFELCNYRPLFTLPYSRYIAWFPGKTDMMLFDVIVKESGEVTSKHSFNIYCKLDGHLRNQFSLGCPQFHDFATPCGRDRIVIQNSRRPEGMQILDISSEIPRLIKTTNLFSPDEPLCLEKTRQFVCKNKNHSSVASRYSVDVFNLQGECSVTLRDSANSLSFFSITENEDVAIFVSAFPLSINIKRIVTGESLANIGVNDSMSSWNRFQIDQSNFIYDDKTHDMAMLNFNGNCCIWSNKFFEHD